MPIVEIPLHAKSVWVNVRIEGKSQKQKGRGYFITCFIENNLRPCTKKKCQRNGLITAWYTNKGPTLFTLSIAIESFFFWHTCIHILLYIGVNFIIYAVFLPIHRPPVTRINLQVGKQNFKGDMGEKSNTMQGIFNLIFTFRIQIFNCNN